MTNIELGLFIFWFLTALAWGVDRKFGKAQSAVRCDGCQEVDELKRDRDSWKKLSTAQANQLNSMDAHLRILEQRTSSTKDKCQPTN